MTQHGEFYPYLSCDVCGEIDTLWNGMNPTRSSFSTYLVNNFCSELCKEHWLRTYGKDYLYKKPGVTS